MPRFDDNALDPAMLDGIWWDFSTGAPCPDNRPHAEHGCFLVVPKIGSRFDAVLAEEQLPYIELLRKSGEDVELRDKTLARCKAKAMARTILRGWANWQNADGSDMEFSEESAYRLLSDRRFLVYAEFVAECSVATHAARMREEVAAEGN